MKTKNDVLFQTAIDLKMDLKDVEQIYTAMTKGLYEKVIKDKYYVFIPLYSIGTLVFSRSEYKKKNLLTGTKTRPRGATDKILVVEEANRKYKKIKVNNIATSDARYQSFKYIKNRNPFVQKKSVRFYGLEDKKNDFNTLEELENYQEKIFYEEDVRFRK